MSRRAQQLAALERIARAKADRELRRFAAYRAQVDAMRQQVGSVRAELAEAATAPETPELSQWQMTTALVGYRAGQLHRAEEALHRMQPGLDAARASAAVAFGRAEALGQLRRMTLSAERQDRARRALG